MAYSQQCLLYNCIRFVMTPKNHHVLAAGRNLDFFLFASVLPEVAAAASAFRLVAAETVLMTIWPMAPMEGRLGSKSSSGSSAASPNLSR